MSKQVRIPVEVANNLKLSIYDRWYKWDGTDGCRNELVVNPSDVQINAIDIDNPLPYELHVGWWVAASALTEIETEKETPDEIWLYPGSHEWTEEKMSDDVKYLRSKGILSRYAKPVDEPDVDGPVEIGTIMWYEHMKEDLRAFRSQLVKITKTYKDSMRSVDIKALNGVLGIRGRTKEANVNTCTLRLATPDDWIVEIGGVKWRAEWNQWSSNGNSPYYPRLTVLYKTKGKSGWFDIGADYNDHDAHNKAMIQLCKSLNVPNKTF